MVQKTQIPKKQKIINIVYLKLISLKTKIKNQYFFDDNIFKKYFNALTHSDSSWITHDKMKIK